MKITTICGSMRHIEAMIQAATQLCARGYEVEVPNPREGEIAYDTLDGGTRANLKSNLIQECLDKISLGALVQAEYGPELKDPLPHFTNGKLSRLQLLENALFNATVQLPKGE